MTKKKDDEEKKEEGDEKDGTHELKKDENNDGDDGNGLMEGKNGESKETNNQSDVGRQTEKNDMEKNDGNDRESTPDSPKGINSEFVDLTATTPKLYNVVDLSVDRPAHGNKKKRDRMIDWNVSLAFQQLQKRTREKIKSYWTRAEDGPYIWQNKDTGTSVSTDNLVILLKANDAIANNVVDAFGELLAEELQSIGKSKTTIFSSIALLSIFNNKIECLNGFLMTPLFRLYGISDMFLFPMINIVKFHYTLLVFYKVAKKWVLYNPYRGRRANARDKCFENSKKIKNVVEEWMKNTTEDATQLLKDK